MILLHDGGGSQGSNQFKQMVSSNINYEQEIVMILKIQRHYLSLKDGLKVKSDHVKVHNFL